MSAFDLIADPATRAAVETQAAAIILASLQGGVDIRQALAAPRELAVCHETGHTILAAADGLGIRTVEVFMRTLKVSLRKAFNRAPTKDEVREFRKKIGSRGIWGGFTHYDDSSPFALDKEDACLMSERDFNHLVRMLLGGVAGELILYHSKIPALSSIDEILLSQIVCAARAPSENDGKALWFALFEQTCNVVKSHESAARQIIKMFAHRDEIGGGALESILRPIRLNEAWPCPTKNQSSRVPESSGAGDRPSAAT